MAGIHQLPLEPVLINHTNPIWQFATGTKSIEITFLRLAQAFSVVSQNASVRWIFKSAGATISSVVPRKLDRDPNSATATLLVVNNTQTGVNATTTGTNIALSELNPDAFNVISQYSWQPTFDDRIIIPESTIAAFEFTGNIAGIWRGWVNFAESR